MKLSELKRELIEQFFTEDSIGISQDKLDLVFESIGKTLGLDLNSEKLTTLTQHQNKSLDPSKAFKRFTEGRMALLTIIEEDGSNVNAIFAAIRSGTHVKMSDLTTAAPVEKSANLLTVKNALRQAKKRNDEVYFNIIVTD